MFADQTSVLVVDDQSEVRILLYLSLAPMNYKVFMAPDGDTALTLAEGIMPDIVILDVLLPGGISGLEVCRKLKARKTPPKVILLSALTQMDDIKRGYEAGADSYITKPFSPMALIREIQAIKQNQEEVHEDPGE